MFTSKNITNPRIATIINYCSTDYTFINRCINSVKPFSCEIIVVTSSHFFDGTNEDEVVLQKSRDENPSARFIKHDWRSKPSHPQFWVKYSRWIGVSALVSEYDYVFFIDSDEIIDNSFLEWLNSQKSLTKDAYLLKAYWYFREENYRAKTWEHAGVLIKKEKVDRIGLLSEPDRCYLLDRLPKRKKMRDVVSIDGKPMIHHYSWVRTKEQMLRKVNSWGHKYDRDWKSLVEEEFSRDFNGTDFVHNYEYTIFEQKGQKC